MGNLSPSQRVTRKCPQQEQKVFCSLEHTCRISQRQPGQTQLLLAVPSQPRVPLSVWLQPSSGLGFSSQLSSTKCSGFPTPPQTPHSSL